jgi:radical SAM protein with 4Fe4S-binding SPASM domain
MGADQDQYKLPLPKVIRIEPSSCCNLKCRHCTTGLRMNKSLGIMSRETFDRVFDRIRELDFRAIVLYHGGEPLLNPDLFYFVAKTRPLTQLLKLSSNGMLLDAERIEQILESPLDIVQFSLDGTSPEENDEIRVNSDFRQVAQKIRRLLERRKSVGSALQVYLANVQIPEPGADLTQITVPPHLRAAFGESLQEMTVRCYYPLYWPGYPESGESRRGEAPVERECDHIVSTITVRWNGDVVPCCYDLTSRMVMGNLVTQSLEEIWNGPRYLAMRKTIAEGHPPALCRGCNVLYPKTYMYAKDIVGLPQPVGVN